MRPLTIKKYWYNEDSEVVIFEFVNGMRLIVTPVFLKKDMRILEDALYLEELSTVDAILDECEYDISLYDAEKKLFAMVNNSHINQAVQGFWSTEITQKVFAKLLENVLVSIQNHWTKVRGTKDGDEICKASCALIITAGMGHIIVNLSKNGFKQLSGGPMEIARRGTHGAHLTG